ncbi:hypothetical protein L596_005690 [Steinernema carpocapsae]|uniref:Uncharacterized protein n=1 Tax=Steinernema carpocapsae TaxID=34508 RepID=A0A4U8UZU4_STECR|nr:hypothetical protein L596_005690 [Steinernema carpocapsae]
MWLLSFSMFFRISEKIALQEILRVRAFVDHLFIHRLLTVQMEKTCKCGKSFKEADPDLDLCLLCRVLKALRTPIPQTCEDGDSEKEEAE